MLSSRQHYQLYLQGSFGVGSMCTLSRDVNDSVFSIKSRFIRRGYNPLPAAIYMVEVV